MALRRALPIAVAALLLPAAALAAASDGDDALRLAQRAAFPSGYGHVDVLLHALPKELPAAVPLPSASLLGSVVRYSPASERGYGSAVIYSQPMVALFYDVPGDRNEVLGAYERRLAAGGWKAIDPTRTFPGEQGGFVRQLPDVHQWCSGDTPPSAVTFTAPSGAPHALDVSFVKGSPGTRMMCERNSFFDAIPKSPLPTFTQPPGIELHGAGSTTPGWTSGAQLETSLTLPAVFEAFAKQLRDAGWNPGEVTSGSTLRSQTFMKTVDGKAYVALLTIYALDATHDVALADVTPALR